MNRNNLQRLRDAISQSPFYEQGAWAHGCGAPACIAGHAWALQCADRGWKYRTGEGIGDYSSAIDSRGNEIYYEERLRGWIGGDRENLGDLFAGDAGTWPEPYRTEFMAAGDAEDILPYPFGRRIRRLLQRNAALGLLDAMIAGAITWDHFGVWA